MQLREIKELIRAVSDSDIAEFILEDAGADLRLVLRKGSAMGTQVEAPVQVVPQPAAQPAPVAPQVPVGEPAEEDYFNDPRYVTITAPMVGTFYRAPAPDAPPYVNVGDEVEEGQALCIIEAMKLMNEIESETRGRVVKILVENAEPVEYGQPLFVLEKM